MANVLGTGPVAITTKAGAHAIIALGSLVYNADGTVSISGWPKVSSAEDNVDDKKTAKDWIAYLVAEEELKAAPVPAAPPSGPAFLVQAVNPGVLGNNIKLAISNVVDAAPPSFAKMDIEVDIVDEYDGLTVDNMIDKVGGASTPGSKPGLVHVMEASVLMPNAKAATALAGSPPTLVVEKTGGGGTAFTLAAAANDGGADITFTAAVAVTGPTTFSLTVHWHRKVIASTLAQHHDKFASVIDIQPPPGGYRVPKPTAGPVALAQGDDPHPTTVPAVPATKAFDPAA